MKEVFNIQFNRFIIQFGDDESSNLNQVLSTLVQGFSQNKIEFKIGNIDNKLEPFTQLTKLIRVKKIDVFLKVLNTENAVIGTFKFEDCNFGKINNVSRFLNSFTYREELSSYDRNLLVVEIDAENIYFDDLLLYKKEYKKNIAVDSLEKDSYAKRPSRFEEVGEYAGEVAMDMEAARPVGAMMADDVREEAIFDGRGRRPFGNNIRLGGELMAETAVAAG
jgi:hypothetical protein